ERHGAVVRLLGFRQRLVRDEAGMLLPAVVPLRTVLPALGEALLCPAIVRVLREELGEREDIVAERDAGGEDRFRLVTPAHDLGAPAGLTPRISARQRNLRRARRIGRVKREQRPGLALARAPYHW